MGWLRKYIELQALYVVVAILVVLGLVIGAQHVEVGHLKNLLQKAKDALTVEKADRANERDAAVNAALVASENYRATEARMTAANEKASHDYATTLKDRERTIAGLRTERGRLRSDIARYTAASRQARPDATTGRCADDPRVEVLGRLLSGGVDVVGAGQDTVSALAGQVTALQTYIHDVCLAK